MKQRKQYVPSVCTVSTNDNCYESVQPYPYILIDTCINIIMDLTVCTIAHEHTQLSYLLGTVTDIITIMC